MGDGRWNVRTRVEVEEGRLGGLGGREKEKEEVHGREKGGE